MHVADSEILISGIYSEEMLKLGEKALFCLHIEMFVYEEKNGSGLNALL